MHAMIDACGTTAKYSGKKPPTCDNGEGCAACYQKHHKYLKDNRPKMSRDFKEFYDYVCTYKRMIQKGRLKPEDMAQLDHYGFVAWLEKTIRTGDYRHAMVMFAHAHKEMNASDKKKAGKAKPA